MQDTKSKIQKTILDAAQTRFVKYGFKKTNMTELAEDTEMSPGNLYRFFISKEEMGAAVVKRLLTQKRLRSEKILKAGNHSIENLKDYCHFLLGFYYELFKAQEHLTELIDLVMTKNADILEELIENKQSIIEQILTSGREKKELQVDNLKAEGSILVSLLAPFLLPNWGLYKKRSIRELKAECSDSIDLIYKGLQAGLKK